MQSILNKIRISALLCSAVLVASPAFAQGVGASVGAGAAPSPLAGAPGTGIGANTGVGSGMGTTTTGTLNSNAANANGAAPSTTAGLGASNSAGVTTVPGDLSANGSIDTAGNAGLDSQQTPASRLAQKSQANANAVRTAPSLNQQTTTSGQAAATANGTVPAQ